MYEAQITDMPLLCLVWRHYLFIVWNKRDRLNESKPALILFVLFLCEKIISARMYSSGTELPDCICICIPKMIQIWVYFGKPWNGTYWYILWPFGIFYSHLEYFTAI
jgi:hypothetical protein